MSTHFDELPNVHTYGFLPQQKMAELDNICDIALTRGGTTSLAEQKLYDMKQIIVPIPRTHDQYDNALWYVKHCQDIILDQKAHDFTHQLKTKLLELKSFKKTIITKDKKAIIDKAKKLILSVMYS